MSTSEEMRKGVSSTEELKKKAENAENKEEARKIPEEAEMEPTDEELDQVAGGRPPILF